MSGSAYPEQGRLYEIHGTRAIPLNGADVIAKATTPITLSQDDSGRLFTNEGGGALIVFNLPPALPGMSINFYCQDGDFLRIVAAAGDTIRIGILESTAGGSKTATAIGDYMKLIAINTTEWVSFSDFGTWTNA